MWGIFAKKNVLFYIKIIPQCFTCTHKHTLILDTFSLLMLYHTNFLSLPQHKCMNFMIFIFFCSYRAGVTMSLLYIDSEFLSNICACGLTTEQRYFCQLQKFPARSFRNFIHKAHSYELFFPFFSSCFLFTMLFPLKLGKTFARGVSEKQQQQKQQMKKLFTNNFTFSLLFLYFLL